jgi:hypothetical protein
VAAVICSAVALAGGGLSGWNAACTSAEDVSNEGARLPSVA